MTKELPLALAHWRLVGQLFFLKDHDLEPAWGAGEEEGELDRGRAAPWQCWEDSSRGAASLVLASVAVPTSPCSCSWLHHADSGVGLCHMCTHTRTQPWEDCRGRTTTFVTGASPSVPAAQGSPRGTPGLRDFAGDDHHRGIADGWRGQAHTHMTSVMAAVAPGAQHDMAVPSPQTGVCCLPPLLLAPAFRGARPPGGQRLSCPGSSSVCAVSRGPAELLPRGHRPGLHLPPSEPS